MLLIVMLVLGWESKLGLSQESFKIGESVEVFFLNQWIPGTVVDKNKKGAVQVRFPFAGTEKLEVFAPQQLRHEYESGAIWRGRLWSDGTGKFKVKAALLKISGDKLSLRTDEGKEIEVQVSKLSEPDQKFVTKLRTDLGGGGILSVEPEAETFSTDRVELGRFNSQPLKLGNRTVSTSGFRLTPDPLRSSLQIKQGGIPVQQNEFTEMISGLIPVGGADQWLLGSVSDRFKDQVPSRLLWGQLSTGKVKVTQALPNGHRILDYHPRSRQLLTYSTKRFEGIENGVLTIWKTDPNETEAKGIVGWKARFSMSDTIRNVVPWARFVSDEVIVQRDQDHRIVAWDFKNKMARWTSPQESFFAPQPVMSYGGKYLFVPEDNQLRILDPNDGSELGTISTADRCSSVCLHPDGKTLAVFTGNRLLIVDLAGQDSIRDVDASPVAIIGDSRSEWVTDRLIAIHQRSQEFVLFDIEKEAPLWTYVTPHGMNSGDANTRTIVAGHLVYSAEPPEPQKGMIIGAVKFPEDKVLKLADELDRAKLLIIKPGSRLRVQISSIEDPNGIRSSLDKQMRDNQWIEDSSSEFSLIAKLYRAEAQRVEYQSFGASFRGGTATSSATIQPFVSSIEIKRGNDLLWSTASSSGAPPILMLRGNESVQDSITKWEKPDPGFFGQCDIPSEILDPAKKRGLGISDITVKGLIARPALPNAGAN
jgi:hypothetical protein